MNQPVSQGTGFQRSSFDKTCSYCGARVQVFVSREAGSDESQDYACPECNKQYTTHAALEPVVSLLAPRSDGKTDQYQETMF